MTVRGCIEAKVRAAGVDRKRGRAIGDLYAKLEAEARARGDATPEMTAAADLKKALAYQAAETRRRTLMQMRAQQGLQGLAAAHADDVREAMLASLSFDPRGKIAAQNVHMIREIVRGQAQGLMTNFLARFRSKAAGLVREKAGLRNVVRELFGENTGDASARELAGAVARGMEYLRLKFNAVGGAIPKLKDWGLPQHHDRLRVSEAGERAWVDFTAPLLDRAKMIDAETGLAMNEVRLRSILAEVHATIRSDGLNELKAGGLPGKSLARRRQEHRFLVFKDAAAWLGYQERFGDGDAFGTVIGHVEAMARDIALMQVMGPNPAATLRFMEGLIKASHAAKAALGGKAGARAARKAAGTPHLLRWTYDEVAGLANRPGNPYWADIGGSVRNVNAAAQLGTAFVSSITDLGTQSLTARINGIPAARVMAEVLKHFNPLNEADRRQALRLGFTAQGWTARAFGAQRVLGEMVGHEWSQRVADTVLRVSLLSPWTEAGRWGFMTAMLGHVTEQAGKPFGELDDALRNSMGRYGIGPGDWELIRATTPWADPETGATFLRAQDVIGRADLHPDAAEKIGMKLQQMVMTEAEFAVITTNPRVQAAMHGGTRPGTFMGEVLRAGVQFKTFAVSMIAMHLSRMAMLSPVERAKYAAHLVIGMTVLGGLAVQARQIVAGRDPMDMNPANKAGARFWTQALTQGGGLGIWGDFLFADVNRFGGGIAETLMGPIIGQATTAAGMIALGDRIAGEKVKTIPALYRFTKALLPGRNLWYTRLAFERLVLDEIEKSIDPDYARRFARIERDRRRDYGQSYFAPPGRGFKRLPDLSKAFQE